MTLNLQCEAVARAAWGEPTRREGGELLWRCPHPERHKNGDAHPSLKINFKKNTWACFPCNVGGTPWALAAFLAGVDPGNKAAVKAWLKQRGLMDCAKRKAKQDGHGPCVAEYLYPDMTTGEMVLLKRRYEPGEGGAKKSFAWFHRTGNEWKPGYAGHTPGLYRPEKVAREAGESEPLIGSESEKDADRGAEIGLATFSWGGAENWRDGLAEPLREKYVVLVAHQDNPGRKCVQEVATSLYKRGASIDVIELPGGADLADWIASGGTAAKFWGLLDAAEWKPAASAEVLDSLMAFIRRFVSLTQSQARAVALWTAHTHAFNAADCTAYLDINSPEKQSGKTRLLEVERLLVFNEWFTRRVTAAVLIRKIDAKHPTLLLDESDAAFGGEKEYAEALRGILNTGYRRGGAASLCVGKGAEMDYRDFSTFCPKAIAGIGKLPDTVADRSIPLRLKRAPRGEVARFREREAQREGSEIAARIAAWCASNLEILRQARPTIPAQLSDRQADCCEPLLAVADLAGGEWPEAARTALVELCVGAQVDDDSIGVRLLQDVQGVFAERLVDEISSLELCQALAQIETGPWGEWSKGKPLSVAKLARLLRPFQITPDRIGGRDSQARGYTRRQFDEAFSLYLPSLPPFKPSTRQPTA